MTDGAAILLLAAIGIAGAADRDCGGSRSGLRGQPYRYFAPYVWTPLRRCARNNNRCRTLTGVPLFSRSSSYRMLQDRSLWSRLCKLLKVRERCGLTPGRDVGFMAGQTRFTVVQAQFTTS